MKFLTITSLMAFGLSLMLGNSMTLAGILDKDCGFEKAAKVVKYP